MNNTNYINLNQLELTTQSLLRKINEQSNLKVDKNSILLNASTGSIIASINGIDIYNGVTFDGNFENLSNIPNFVMSVNENYSNYIYVRELKPYAISKNTSYNLIGIDFNASNTALSNIYKETSISLLENNTNSILSVGNYNTLSKGPGILQLYGGGTASNTGYIQLVPSTTGTATYTLNLPSANGTVALTSDIPNVPSWALATTKPTYTATEVGALSTSTTYVSTFNGQSGAITYVAPVTSVNGQTGAVSLSIPNVSEWALAATKPTYTANEVGAAASNHTHTQIGTDSITGQYIVSASSSGININAAPATGTSKFIKFNNNNITLGVNNNVSNISLNLVITENSFTGIPTPTIDTGAANKKYVDDAIAGITDTNTTYTLSMSGNIITLTPSTGTAQTITLPVYNGGVTP